MKKLLMVVMLLIGIACAGGGYYIFVMKPEQDALDAALAEMEKKDQAVAPIMELKQPEPEPEPPRTEYYVNPERLGVREAPNTEAFIESFVFRGDRLHVYETKDGWGRISLYYVYDESDVEVAEWVPMNELLEVPPIITEEEKVETISRYVEKSDDFKTHFEAFINTTDQLLHDRTCTPEDFDELGGWVKSVRYKQRDVYFIYCGGLKQANKIYLDVQTGEVFYQ